MTTTTANSDQFNQIVELLTIDGKHNGYLVSVTNPRDRGNRIEVRNDPARQIDPTAKLDFMTIREDDGQFNLTHMTHNEVIKGEATFSNSMVGALFPAIAMFFECL